MEEVVQVGRGHRRSCTGPLARRGSEPSRAQRFPKHRQPSNVSNYEGQIAYAVGKYKVFAAQRRAGGIRINPPSGPKGSVTYRWPHEMDVETFAWVSDLRDAPDLRVVLPEFMEKYRKNFWNGSHWQITDDEFKALQAAILEVGEGVPVPAPPFQSP